MKRARRFPADRRSVAAARRFAAEVLDGAQPDVIEAVVLMVSELATNAIHHGNSPFSIVLEQTGGELRVEVNDQSSGVPLVQSPGPDELGGRGLQIVEMLSERWGVVTAPGTGKAVWFTVDTNPRFTLARSRG